MNRVKFQDWSGAVRLLSLLLAGLLWLSVALERNGQMTITVPLQPEYLPVGLRLESPLPEKLEVTVSGPRILLGRLAFGGVSCRLDLTAATAGNVNFVPQEGSFALDRELKILRLKPASISLALVKEAGHK
jgi:YbbR domain-containing protein